MRNKQKAALLGLPLLAVAGFVVLWALGATKVNMAGVSEPGVDLKIGSSEIPGGSPASDQQGSAGIRRDGFGDRLYDSSEEFADIRKMVQDLQNSGASPEVVRSVFRRAVREHQDNRMNQMFYDPVTGQPNWNIAPRSPEMDRVFFELRAEESRLGLELLGPDGVYSEVERERLYGKISNESLVTAMLLNGERHIRRAALREENLTQLENMVRHHLLELEFVQSLDELLPPSDVLQFEYRQTFHGMRLGRAIASAQIEVSDEQLRQLLDMERLKMASSKNHGSYEQLLLNSQLQGETRLLLGDTKFFPFLKETNPAFRRLTQSFENSGFLIAPYQLLALWELNHTQGHAAGEVFRTPGLSPGERVAHYERILQDSQTMIEQIAGREAWIRIIEFDALPLIVTVESWLGLRPSFSR